jgi:hypothetical protein
MTAAGPVSPTPGPVDVAAATRAMLRDGARATLPSSR